MSLYTARITPPHLFVGLSKQIINDEFDDVEEIWNQESIETSYEKLKNGIESLGIECVHIEFGEFDPTTGTLLVNEILCRCLNPKKELFDDEVYIETGISCYEPSYNNKCVAFYFIPHN